MGEEIGGPEEAGVGGAEAAASGDAALLGPSPKESERRGAPGIPLAWC